MKPYGVIYRITNLVNGKHHVGQSIHSAKSRFDNYVKESKAGGGLPLASSMRKHGVENFEFETLASCMSRDDLNATELEIGLQLSSFIPTGYDLILGEGSGSWSEEMKLKWAENRRKQMEDPAQLAKARANQVRMKELAPTPWLGKHLYEETKEQLSSIGKALWETEEHRSKIIRGINTPECRAKKSANASKQEHTPETTAKQKASLAVTQAKKKFRKASHEWFTKREAKKWAGKRFRKISNRWFTAKRDVWTGRKHTPETRAKQSLAKLGKQRQTKTKTIRSSEPSEVCAICNESFKLRIHVAMAHRLTKAIYDLRYSTQTLKFQRMSHEWFMDKARKLQAINP